MTLREVLNAIRDTPLFLDEDQFSDVSSLHDIVELEEIPKQEKPPTPASEPNSPLMPPKMPASAQNLLTQRIQAQAEPKIKTEHPVKVEGEESKTPNPESPSSAVSLERLLPALERLHSSDLNKPPPALEDAKGRRVSSGSDDSGSSSAHDGEWDPTKSPAENRKKNRKNVPWHEALVRGGKMSGARDTRVMFHAASEKWEGKLRLDPILPFQSIGFFETEAEAIKMAKARLKNRQGGVYRGLPGTQRIAQEKRLAEITAPTTRSRTGRLKPKYEPWKPEMEENRPQHLSKSPKIKQEGYFYGRRSALPKGRRKRGRPRIPSSASERHPPLRIPLQPYSSAHRQNLGPANQQMIQQALNRFDLPCPANNYNRRMPQPNVKTGNPYESIVSGPALKKIKTEKSEDPIQRPTYPTLRRQDTALRRFNVQEQMRAQIREAFDTKYKAERRLVMGSKFIEKKASLTAHAKQLDNSISTLFGALEKHEKSTSPKGTDSDSDKDVKNSKELMKQLVQRRDAVGKQQQALELEQAKCSDEVWLRDVLNKSKNQIESLRRKRYSFDGITTIEFIVKQMGWNPFAGLPIDAQSYFTSYLHGNVLKFECEFWTGGSKIVAENICKIIKETTNYKSERMDNIYRNFLIYLSRD